MVEQSRARLAINGMILFVFLMVVGFANAQTPSTPNPPSNIGTPNQEVEEDQGNELKILIAEPNKKRIRRHLSLIAGIKHDEEILIPDIPLNIKGTIDALEIRRIKGTDIFRIFPLKPGSGVTTIHNKKTGQILAEIRFDIRNQSIERTLREIKALLADIEGIEYKIVNGRIVLDGFVLLPKDLKRITQVIGQFQDYSQLSDPPIPPIGNLVSLSPIAKKKIVEYIAREINNPEITVTSVGDFIKLEGFVNSKAERDRIGDIAVLYLPDIVTDRVDNGLSRSAEVKDRKGSANINDYIINLIQIREAEQKVEPAPKMIQIVIHVVEYAERYLKSFDFQFSPSLTGLGEAQSQGQASAPGSISELASIVDNLLPKLNWARTHGYARLLDTASLLVQDKSDASLVRSINVSNGKTSVAPQGGQGGGGDVQTYTLSFGVTKPTIKADRSELVEMAINVNSTAGNGQFAFGPSTTVNTKVSVRSRQSAALAGIISKKTDNQFGGPTGAGSIITLNHGKRFTKASNNYVLFVTPIIKSSASAGVEQVKKKFRFKD
jgi:pilus assembly protein CpaC